MVLPGAWALLVQTVAAGTCLLDARGTASLRTVLRGLGVAPEPNPCNTWGVLCEEVPTCEVLYLSIHASGLSGFISEAVGGLTELRKLHLNDNQLHGPLPVSLGRLTKLTVLDLCNNRLMGEIPESLGQLAQVKRLFLCENQLSGPLPSSLGKLRSLEVLVLYENRLSGRIPVTLRHLPLMEAQFWGNPELEPRRTQRPWLNCGPLAKDPCKIFLFLDPAECLLCVSLSLAFALLGAWLLKTWQQKAAQTPPHAPVGARQLAAAALRPTRWYQHLVLVLAVVSHVFAPLCIAWIVHPELVVLFLAGKALLRNSSSNALSFFPIGLSVGSRSYHSLLSELLEVLLPFTAFAGAMVALNFVDPQKALGILLREDRKVMFQMLADQMTVGIFMACVWAATVLYSLVLCALLIRVDRTQPGQASPSDSDLAFVLARITAQESWAKQDITAQAEPRAGPVEIELVPTGASSAAEPVSSWEVQVENLGKRRLMIHWDGRSCQVQMLTPGQIYQDMGVIVATSFTDLFVAKQFLEGHHVWFAFLTLATSWCSMLLELQTWRNLREELRKSVAQGFYTDRMVALRDSERGCEGFIDLALKVYGMPYGVDSNPDFIGFLFIILMGLRGLVLMLRTRDQLAGY
ncbi:unnamed protein product [Effrenium voratum]|uniref:Disease resistance R13L4/SHOC-2-like LRR domain-containing protein n=1 Tax=Effrenium voratum TaxID=2562239 RepID=A0AA36MZ93_9DINO|nr:unnamed protein product [Effrenium voratum]